MSDQAKYHCRFSMGEYLSMVLACSLNYLFSYGIPMFTVRWVVANDPVAACVVGLGIAYQLPCRSLLLAYLDAVVPALVARASTRAEQQEVLWQARRQTVALAGVAVLVVCCGAVILPGQVRFVFVLFGLATVPQLICSVAAGYFIGTFSPLRSVLVHLGQMVALAMTWFVSRQAGCDSVVAVGLALVAGPLVGAVIGLVLLATVWTTTNSSGQNTNAETIAGASGTIEPRNRTGSVAERVCDSRHFVTAGVFSAVQAGLNMGLVALLHHAVRWHGEEPFTAFSSLYGWYGLLWGPLLGLVNALTLQVSRAIREHNLEQLRRAVGLTAVLCAAAGLAIALVGWSIQGWVFAQAGGAIPGVGFYLPIVGTALLLFLPIDIVINLAGYGVGRGFLAFTLPLVGTVVGLVSFLLGLPFTTGLTSVLVVFLVAQALWAVTVSGGAWRLYRRFCREYGPRRRSSDHHRDDSLIDNAA